MRTTRSATNAVVAMASACADVLAKAGLSATDVTKVIAHQANIRIIRAVGKRLGIDPARVLIDIAEVGNTSAASIPIAMDRAWRAGKVVPGDVKGQDPQIITTTLRELATVTRAELLALGETPRSGTAVGISDEIDVSTYRRAREALSRDLPVLPAAAGRRGVHTNTPVGTELLL